MITEHIYTREMLLENLKELYRLSEFVSYKKLGKDKKKMRKKLKKVIEKVEESDFDGIIDKEYFEGDF